MQTFDSSLGGEIVKEISRVVVENKAHLSDIDGKIGDGDHGVNMAKGFGLTASRLNDGQSLDDALQVLSGVLMAEIGGSMGPLYGTMFMEMADIVEGKEVIDLQLLNDMVKAGLDGVIEIGDAKLGDKTLLDTLIPASESLASSVVAKSEFDVALDAFIIAAENGRDSTVDMVSKVGRSARLGERSRGVVDAGATSCCLILSSFAHQIKRNLKS